MNISFTSYYPLICTKQGKAAVDKYNLKPYIDGSCRREPDFENPYPAITGLCRPGFVERLFEGDLVIYTTNLQGIGVKKFISIFEVIATYDSHELAKEWYIKNNISIPNNLIVNETRPFPLEYTHRRTSCSDCGHDIVEEWDKGYLERSILFPKVAICKTWKNPIDLDNPSDISIEDLLFIFNRIPGTRNPPYLSNDEWKKFQQWLNKLSEKVSK